jgi:hypothetical protein
MNIARILFVTIASPALACVILSIFFYISVNRVSFVPMIFALPGSMLLATIYGVLQECRFTTNLTYLIILLAGSLVGGIWLGLLTASPQWAPLGASYGASTAICWIALHWLTKRTQIAVRGPKL